MDSVRASQRRGESEREDTDPIEVVRAAPARDVAELIAAMEAGLQPRFVFFWGHRPSSDGQIVKSCLSQWWPAEFEVEGVRYATAEHFMMAEKARLFGDLETLARILAARSPAEAKKLGRMVEGFDSGEWERARFEIVVRGSVGKFGQNPLLGRFLLGTGQRVLVEASPLDAIWGIGMPEEHPDVNDPSRWKGLNLLGFALMEARHRLAGAAAADSTATLETNR
jgi:ribA/ribD-fused uncharacterized protein